jgi:hypothetical protein
MNYELKLIIAGFGYVINSVLFCIEVLNAGLYYGTFIIYIYRVVDDYFWFLFKGVNVQQGDVKIE